MLHIGKVCLPTQFLAFLTAVALSNAATTTSTIRPDSAKECAICHYSWVDTFFIEKRGSELVPLPERERVASEEMCFSCHDGSTVDSREKAHNDRKHRVGIIPSENVKIPEIFPLNEEGAMDCRTCHSAHGVSTKPGIEKTIFLRTSNANSEMCKLCHVGKDGGREKGNHPVDKTTLNISEELLAYGGHSGTEPNQVICESCHVAHGGFTDQRLVLPVDRPSTYPVLCEACHGKTPGLNKNLQLNLHSHSGGQRPENTAVPEKWENGNDIRLGSRGELVCVTCHTVHNPPVREFLLAEKNEKDSLCLQCHTEQAGAIAGSKHDLSVTAPEAQNIRGETIAQSGPCSCCHLTHEGVGPFMWARQWEGDEEPPVGICKSCHARGQCAEEVLMPETGHPVGIQPDSPTADLEFPLFTKTGKPDKQGELYCSSCHNTHQWDPLNPENKGSADEEGDSTTSFLRAANQDSVLCLGCHKEAAAVGKTDHDLSQSAPEERNSLDQSPEQSGLCGSCHLAHGGADAFMWSRPLEGGDDPIMVQLCVECHGDDACGKEKQVGDFSHPVNVHPDDSLELQLPLFLPGGKQDPDGMVFCSTCHDPHQWDPSDPEKKGEEGTPADSFLRLSSNDSSPLCSECHQSKSYIEGTEHDLRMTAPDEKNKHDDLPGESGLCAQCHAVHNASLKLLIWNRELGPPLLENWNEEFSTPNNLMVGFCTSCHAPDACAEGKIPDYGLHPTKLYMALMEEKADVLDNRQFDIFINQFPIYTEEGVISVEGDIVCSTCHDPHLWDARTPEKAPGKDVEATVTNSFLRRDVAFSFCSSCHGEETLLKFKFFHSMRGRKREVLTSHGDE